MANAARLFVEAKMKSYRCAEIAQLAHELTLSPLRHRLRQLAGMKRLVGLADPEREYPYSFVCFHITGFRPRKTQDTLLSGKDLIADLIMLMDSLTAANPLPVRAARGRLYEVDALAGRFRVSTKTISRWRNRGLAGCWYTVEGEKPRLAFAGRDVEVFVSGHLDLVRRGSTFQLMGREEKEQIIARARELVASERCGLHVTTVRLAEETGRAIETIRYTLRRFDREHPDEALFDRAEQPREIDEETVIYQAYVTGDSVRALAERFGKREARIRRILTSVRAAELLATPVSYVYNESFDALDAEQEILGVGREPAGAEADDVQDVTLIRPPAELPAYLRDLYRTPLLGTEEERRLFRRMNFLLHQAEILRQQLPSDPAAVKASAIGEIDDLVQRAGEIKNRIIQANLRLVVSIAKRHLRGAGSTSLFELISDGNVALMRAAEKFDYAKGFKFSTYASWAIKRTFARSIPDELCHAGRFQTGHDELLSIARDHRGMENVTEADTEDTPQIAVARSLRLLDRRERSIVEHHFGLADGGTAKTLDEIGRHFGISKERVRQIEQRALKKLRHTLGEQGAELLAG
ncbi:MAG: sigma-70 family RNA polymerase sigma factor [Phycisphaerae bacterium]|nr:sigma-70 family RNA polymerase sigma factor [Phycisphaerae bacterium]